MHVFSLVYLQGVYTHVVICVAQRLHMILILARIRYKRRHARLDQETKWICKSASPPLLGIAQQTKSEPRLPAGYTARLRARAGRRHEQITWGWEISRRTQHSDIYIPILCDFLASLFLVMPSRHPTRTCIRTALNCLNESSHPPEPYYSEAHDTEQALLLHVLDRSARHRTDDPTWTTFLPV